MKTLTELWRAVEDDRAELALTLVFVLCLLIAAAQVLSIANGLR
jgi:hypothetical protein